jgi:O-antigen/teichoic acid export membrane protein
MSSANRVIKNTGFLYAKMGITMFISLYTTRLILDALGASDFGIFNVVGGAIALLGFLHAAMSSATQRFMSFYEGRGEIDKQKQIFNVSLVLHFFIALGLGLVLLIAGYFFFNGVLNIAPERIYAAKVVYASLIISTMFTVMSVPYEAVLNAHENMLYYSVLGVLESLLKLTVALIVVYYIGDKLELYGILMACIPLLVLTIMRVYCHKKYTECVISPRKYWTPNLMREMTSFAGWSLFGTASGMISQYGMGIVLNMFFGTILNAAQGIANQLSGQLMAFSNTMMKALNPVIAKSEGGGNRELMLKATLMGSKFSFMLLAFFVVPFIIEAPYILKLWLKEIPDWAIVFTILQLIRSLVEQLTVMLPRAIAAKGDIKKFSMIKSVLNILPVILTYICFSYNMPPYYLYITWILVSSILGGGVSLYFTKLKCELDYNDYFKKVLIPCLGILFIMTISGILVHNFFDASFFKLVMVFSTTTLTFFLSVYLIFLSVEEKILIDKLIMSIKNRFKK